MSAIDTDEGDFCLHDSNLNFCSRVLCSIHFYLSL